MMLRLPTVFKELFIIIGCTFSVLALANDLSTEAPIVSKEESLISDSPFLTVDEVTQMLSFPTCSIVRPVSMSKKPKLVYPKILRMYGNKGEVTLNFTISQEGKVADIQVMASAHPELERAAIDALLTAEFVPARACGKNVEVQVGQKFTFTIQDEAGSLFRSYGGDDMYLLKGKSSEKLPEDFRYDVPPQAKVVVGAVYSFELLKKSTQGSADVLFVVNPEGEVTEAIIKKATNPDFGDAAKAMMEAWKFTPATLNGRPTWAILHREISFDRNNRDTWLNDSAAQLLDKVTSDKAFLTIDKLDSMPHSLYQPLPNYPLGYNRNQPPGRVMVEFFIDENGWVQLPHIIEASNNELGWAALTAVARWRFEPPIFKGKPVNVIARMPISFATVPDVAEGATSQ